MTTGFLELAELDLARYKAAGVEPTHVFARPPGAGVWVTTSGPLNADRIVWMEDRTSAHVVVPTVRYLVPPVPEALFAFGLEVAARALAQLRRPVSRMVLALGRPAEDLRPDQDAFAIRVGLAFLVRE